MKWGIVIAAIAAFLLTAGWIGYRTVKERRISFAALLLIMLILTVAEPIVEHAVLGTEYPIERIAFYYIPIAGLLAVSVIDQVISGAGALPQALGAAFCLFLASWMFVHLLRTGNTHYTMAWRYDSNTKTAVSEIARNFDTLNVCGKVNIGNNWVFAPTINFYRTTRHYDWLGPAMRDGLAWEANDVIYCYFEDLDKDAETYTVMQRYPDTGSVLIKINRER